MSEKPPSDLAGLDADDDHLVALGPRFLDAMRAVAARDVDGASEILRGVLRVEPRLAEPRLELARVLLETGQIEEAEEQAREALRILESGGQWMDDVPENVLLSVAFDLLGEVVSQRADSDEVVFGDPTVWKALIDEAAALYRRAYVLDPTNEHAASKLLDVRPVGGVANDADDADESDDEDGPEDDSEVANQAPE